MTDLLHNELYKMMVENPDTLDLTPDSQRKVYSTFGETNEMRRFAIDQLRKRILSHSIIVERLEGRYCVIMISNHINGSPFLIWFYFYRYFR